METKLQALASVSTGFLALPRDVIHSLFMGSKSLKTDDKLLFYYLLYKATWTDLPADGLKRGELVYTVANLSLETGRSEKFIRNYLKILEEKEYITIGRWGRMRVLRFVNYDELCKCGTRPRRGQRGARAAVAAEGDNGFAEFWSEYCGYTGYTDNADKKRAQQEWDLLSEEERKDAVDFLYGYFEMLRDKSAAKKPSAYLSSGCFIL